MAPYCFIICRICMYCLITWFTSCTVVPLPLAIRLLSAINHAMTPVVIELIIASTCFNLLSSTLASFGNCCSGHFRQHIHQLLQRPDPSNLLQLIANIFQREPFVPQLAFQFRRRLFVHRLFARSISDMMSPIPSTRDTMRSG